MKIFRIIFCFLFFCFFKTSKLYGQKIYVESGLVNAFFKNYKDSNGNNNLSSKIERANKSFFEVGASSETPIDYLTWDLGVNYSDYKINTAFIYGLQETPITYNLAYVAVKTGFNFELFNIENFMFKLHGSVSYDLLVSGNYTYLNTFVDIYKNKSFDKSLIRYHLGPNVHFFISRENSLYFKYNVSSSFREKNKDTNKGESYNLRANALSIGFLFALD